MLLLVCGTFLSTVRRKVSVEAISLGVYLPSMLPIMRVVFTKCTQFMCIYYLQLSSQDCYSLLMTSTDSLTNAFTYPCQTQPILHTNLELHPDEVFISFSGKFIKRLTRC